MLTLTLMVSGYARMCNCLKVYGQLFLYALILLGLLLKSQCLAAKNHSLICVGKAKKATVNTMEPLLLEIELNQRRLPNIAQCYIDASGQLWVSEADLLEWGLILPSHTARNYHKKPYYQLSWYPYLTYQLDRYAMKLLITAPAIYFPTRVFGEEIKNAAPFRPTEPGGFFNYSATAIHNVAPNVPYQNGLSALSEVGFFNQWGIGTSSLLVYSNYDNHSMQDLRTVRLDSTWTLDQPEHMASWRLGDSLTGAADWSGAARFGGIQYATNFNTQPNFITFPLPGYKGAAVLPSNLDIFVNSALQQQQTVDQGPYVLNNIPVITGAGTLSIVRQDILGRTQVVNIPYYASPALLKPDLTSFSYEMGFVRDNYGIDSARYGQFLTTATYQRGITNKLTMGTHTELLSDHQALGFSGNYLLNQYGVVSFALAGSHGTGGGGALASVGFSRQTPTLTYGAKATLMSANFSDIAIQPGPGAPNITNQVFVGYSSGDYGSWGLSYTDINNQAFSDASLWTGQRIELATATYSHQIFKKASLMCGGVADLCNRANSQLFLSITFGLDEARTLSAYSSYQNHQAQPLLQVAKNLPLGTGYGYHVLTTNNLGNSLGGDVSLQNDVGTYTARVYRSPDQLNYEMDISGGIVYLGGNMRFSRQIDNSFAVVQVPEFKDVGVYYQNQLIGHTDARGNLLIPQLLPYQENKIEIESKDLPLNAAFTSTQNIVVPYSRSGVLVKFAVKKVCSATLHLVMANGEFVPPGATVKLENDEKEIEYPVGYEGELYLANIVTDTIKGIVEWDDHICHFTLRLPKTDQAITDLGNVTCY